MARQQRTAPPKSKFARSCPKCGNTNIELVVTREGLRFRCQNSNCSTP